ncbi:MULTISPECIES: VirD2 family relaxase/mobilization nuclease [unclassified Xanthobacter]|uniref:relaxase/mobilization nuclease domain-containing protein n=1 Tax=unclassified Xanthobacter TaxID=2623496 RepID=UPI001F227F8C|nr:MULTISPECIES: VirD2 family relaxase/mobilization nuclease [unclassified Xanthobacter]
MTRDDNFRVRPGRIRSSRAQRAKPFVAQALAAAQKAGGRISRAGKITSGSGSRFGRGRTASVRANRLITSRSRGAVVKARVVWHTARSTPLAAHLVYLRREGVTRDGEKARMFGPDTDEADVKDFGESCQDDRHHFRFIVSPDDAVEMSDLRSFTRDLMAQVEEDLGTKLDWVAVDHWNTEHPHVHVILRGRADDGRDLVIARDYIKEGMRSRAQDLVTQDLGPRTDHDIRHALERQIEAERWTQVDRQLKHDADRSGLVDLAPAPDRKPDAYLALKVGRLRKLESFGLAEAVSPGRWIIVEEAEATLRELGERGDIIKRMHHALTERGIERGLTDYVLSGEIHREPIIGRLVDRGLDDELRGTAFAVVDGIDGRTHHIRFSDLDAAGDSAPGSVVELRRYEDTEGRTRTALAVRSDLSIEAQVTATGATWLDRRLVTRDPAHLGGGFGLEVQQAMAARTDHLVSEGFARREGQRIVFARNLLTTLRERELNALGQRLAGEMGAPFQKVAADEYVAGTYRQRFALASGRFALIGGGLGFQLVPWTPSIEKYIGQEISGVARADGGIDWSFGRKRGLGL